MDRAERGRDDSRTVEVARAHRPDNAARRLLVRASIGLMAAGLAGCSLSFPVKGVEVDAAATGSIRRPVTLLSPALDGEDLRRAEAAMAVALDPQGNGARVGWQNPQTGAHGAFTAARAPYAERDRVCRAFTGEVASGQGAQRAVHGSACREVDGSWLLQGDT